MRFQPWMNGCLGPKGTQLGSLKGGGSNLDITYLTTRFNVGKKHKPSIWECFIPPINMLNGGYIIWIHSYIYLHISWCKCKRGSSIYDKREGMNFSIYNTHGLVQEYYVLFYQRKLTYLEFQSRWDIACSFPVTPVHMQCIKLLRFSKWPFRCCACTCWQMRSVGSGNNLIKHVAGIVK